MKNNLLLLVIFILTSVYTSYSVPDMMNVVDDRDTVSVNRKGNLSVLANNICESFNIYFDYQDCSSGPCFPSVMLYRGSSPGLSFPNEALYKGGEPEVCLRENFDQIDIFKIGILEIIYSKGSGTAFSYGSGMNGTMKIWLKGDNINKRWFGKESNYSMVVSRDSQSSGKNDLILLVDNVYRSFRIYTDYEEFIPRICYRNVKICKGDQEKTCFIEDLNQIDMNDILEIKIIYGPYSEAFVYMASGACGIMKIRVKED